MICVVATKERSDAHGKETCQRRGQHPQTRRRALGGALYRRLSISEKTGLGVCTVQAAIAGKNVTMHSADKIAEALGRSRLDLFIDVEKRKTLDANTVRGYHRLISSILTKSCEMGLHPIQSCGKCRVAKADAKRGCAS